jgi:hypothetical protein
MLEVLGNFIGWFGTITVLTTYGLTLFKVLPFGGDVFLIANMAGSISLVIGGAFKRDMWHNVVFYLIWGVLTALAYFNVFHLLIK